MAKIFIVKGNNLRKVWEAPSKSIRTIWNLCISTALEELILYLRLYCFLQLNHTRRVLKISDILVSIFTEITISIVTHMTLTWYYRKVFLYQIPYLKITQLFHVTYILSLFIFKAVSMKILKAFLRQLQNAKEYLKCYGKRYNYIR